MSVELKEGWIALHRSMRKNPRYKNSAWVHVWVELLLSATHARKEVIFKGKRITLEPGQLLTGRKLIMRNTGLNEYKIERILKVLQNEQQITQQTSNINRLITISNWKSYQEIAQVTAQRAHNECTTSAQRPHTYNNDNNVENDNNEERERGALRLFDEFWKEYPKKRGKDAAERIWIRRKLDPTALVIMAALQKQKNSRDWRKNDGEFIPNPATWLNQGRWKDEILEKKRPVDRHEWEEEKFVPDGIDPDAEKGLGVIIGLIGDKKV